MPRPCSICVHPDRAAIDSALRTEAYRVVAKRFGINSAAAYRHKTEHLATAKRSTLPKRSKAIEAEPVDETAEPIAEKAKLPRSVASLPISQRDTEILDKRIKGMLPRQIAQEMGIGRETVSTVLAKALEDAANDRSDRANQWLALELERLDKLQASLWDRATDTFSAVADGENGGKAYDAQDKAVDRVMKVMERRHKLLGLEKAPQAQVTDGPTEQPVQRFIVELATPERPTCPPSSDPPNGASSQPTEGQETG